MSDEKKPEISIVTQAKPAMMNVSFGGAMGFCSAYALKKTGKALAYLIGITFVALQLAVAAGYITVDWKKIEDDAAKKIDQTGDGKFNDEDVNKIWAKAKTLLTNHVPSASGFSLGFLYGLKF